MKPAKALTIRLSADQARDLETVADVDDKAVAEVIRAAIADHIAVRRRDPDFQRGLRQRIDEASSLLRDR